MSQQTLRSVIVLRHQEWPWTGPRPGNRETTPTVPAAMAPAALAQLSSSIIAASRANRRAQGCQDSLDRPRLGIANSSYVALSVKFPLVLGIITSS